MPARLLRHDACQKEPECTEIKLALPRVGGVRGATKIETEQPDSLRRGGRGREEVLHLPQQRTDRWGTAFLDTLHKVWSRIAECTRERSVKEPAGPRMEVHIATALLPHKRLLLDSDARLG